MQPLLFKYCKSLTEQKGTPIDTICSKYIALFYTMYVYYWRLSVLVYWYLELGFSHR